MVRREGRIIFSLTFKRRTYSVGPKEENTLEKAAGTAVESHLISVPAFQFPAIIG